MNGDTYYVSIVPGVSNVLNKINPQSYSRAHCRLWTCPIEISTWCNVIASRLVFLIFFDNLYNFSPCFSDFESSFFIELLLLAKSKTLITRIYFPLQIYNKYLISMYNKCENLSFRSPIDNNHARTRKIVINEGYFHLYGVKSCPNFRE